MKKAATHTKNLTTLKRDKETKTEQYNKIKSKRTVKENKSTKSIGKRKNKSLTSILIKHKTLV